MSYEAIIGWEASVVFALYSLTPSYRGGYDGAHQRLLLANLYFVYLELEVQGDNNSENVLYGACEPLR